MKLHPRANSLLFSLLEDTFLNQLIEGMEDKKYKENCLILFYSLNLKNHIFEIVDDKIKVDELKFKKELKSAEGPQGVTGKLILEKYSIIWKIKIEGFKKPQKKRITEEVE